MNAEIKARWIEALRSGKYQQGIGYLRSKNDRFCCLGVLCDTYLPSKWELIADYFVNTETSAAFLPSDLRNLADLSHEE